MFEISCGVERSCGGEARGRDNDGLRHGKEEEEERKREREKQRQRQRERERNESEGEGRRKGNR